MVVRLPQDLLGGGEGAEGSSASGQPSRQSPLQWTKGMLIVTSRMIAGFAVLGVVMSVYQGFTYVPTVTGVVSYCGTEYHSGIHTAQPLAQVRSIESQGLAPGESLPPLVQVAKAPWLFGERVYAAEQPPGGACPREVWVRSGADSYVEFDLPAAP